MALVFSVADHSILGKIPEAYLVDDETGYVNRQVYPQHFESETFVEKTKVLIECFDLLKKLDLSYFFERLGINPKDYNRFSSKERNKAQIDYYLKLQRDRLCTLLSLLSQNNVAFVLNVERDKIIKRLRFATNTDLDLFFTRIDNNISYQLKLSINERTVDLHNKAVEVLNVQPAWCVIDNWVFNLPDIKATFLNPFTKNNEIRIPHSTFDEYLKKIIAPLTESSEITIHTNGIDVQVIDEPRETRFTVEKHLHSNNWVCYVHYIYGKKRIASGSSKQKLSSVEDINGKMMIQQIIRNHTVEAEHLKIIDPDLSLRNGCIEIPASNLEDVQLWIENQAKRTTNFVINEGWFLNGKKVNTGKQEFSVQANNSAFDWFDVNISISIGGIEVPFADIAEAVNNGKDAFILEDGQWFIIPNAWKSKIALIQKHAVVRGKKTVLPQFTKHVLNDVRTNAPTVKDVDVVHPEKFVYRPYQLLAIEHMLKVRNQQHGFLLADDMGLGKTLQVLGVLASLHNAEIVGSKSESNHTNGHQLSLFEEENTTKSTSSLPALILVPPALVTNWARETKRFFPHLSVAVHLGQDRSQKSSWLNKHDLIISSYHTMRSDADLFAKMNISVLVLDEAHVIKNPQSQLHQSVKSVNAAFSIALTGTPIENNLMDLWSIFSIIEPNLFGKTNDFNRNYRNPIERNQDEFVLEQLKKILHPFMLRRSKQMVAPELPELEEQVVYNEMTDEQSELYEETKSKVRNAIIDAKKEGEDINLNIHILNGLTRLRQIANHPELVDEVISSGKFNQITSDAVQIYESGDSVIIFSTFTSHLALIERELKTYNIDSLVYTGSLNNTQRQVIIDEFSTSKKGNVLLMSLKAGGVGLNLTRADYVLLADPWWNPQAESQAIARAHRIGREKKVTVKKYLSTGTIEEKIFQLQQQKQVLADEVLSMAENQFANLSPNVALEIIG